MAALAPIAGHEETRWFSGLCPKLVSHGGKGKMHVVRVARRCGAALPIFVCQRWTLPEDRSRVLCDLRASPDEPSPAAMLLLARAKAVRNAHSS